MKYPFLLFVILLASYMVTMGQNSIKMLTIDSIVAANELRAITIFQKTEKNRIWASHGKNPDKISTAYRFTYNDTLISSTYSSYSPGDTQIIMDLYFNSGNLIKVRTREFDMNNCPTDYHYYFDKNQLINKEMDTIGIHKGTYYIEWANRIRRSLKRKSIRFP